MHARLLVALDAAPQQRMQVPYCVVAQLRAVRSAWEAAPMTRDVAILTAELGSSDVSRRVAALWRMRKLGPAAAAAAEQIAALLDDESVAHETSEGNFDHDWHETFIHPAFEAIWALSTVAPERCVDRVARAMVRIYDRVRRIEHTHGGEIVHRLRWGRLALQRFGQRLEDELRAIALNDPDPAGSRAAQILADLRADEVAEG